MEKQRKKPSFGMLKKTIHIKRLIWGHSNSSMKFTVND